MKAKHNISTVLLISSLALTALPAHAYNDFVYPATMCQGTSSDLGYNGPERTYRVYGDPVWVTCPVPRHAGDGSHYNVTVYARDINWDEDIQCELESYTLSGDLYDASSTFSTGHTGNVEPFSTWVSTVHGGPIVLRCLLPRRGGGGGSAITFYRVESYAVVE